ncbi:MAG: MFS transporter [Lachnospiraceae bacterium]|nr:MFS transporter [Lachnospiraceae bacterium]
MKETKKEREARELERLQHIAKMKKPMFYMGITMIVLTIVYVVDEITSNMNSAMQPYILFDLFNVVSRNVNDPAYKHAINVIAPLSMLSTFLLIITPFYKALSDRFGRRIFLMINTVGMGVGMLIVMTSSSVVQYIIGVFVMTFFTPNDVQVLYIMETAPKEKRATYSFVAKGVALISVSLIGVFSKMFLTESDVSSWKLVYVIPVIMALVIGIFSGLFVRETPVFLEQRIEYLSLTEEERKARKEKEKEQNISENGGVFAALKYIFKNKQLRWILIAGFIFFTTTVYTSYYATVLEGAMSTDMVATALLIYPLCNGVMTIFSGFLSDSLGRKKVCFVLGAITIIGLLVFIIACRGGLGPIVAGIAYGLSIGGLWSMSDTIILTMPAESTPSNMRASVMGTISVLIGAGMFVGQGLFVVCQNFIPMDMVFLVISVPFMMLSLMIIMAKVKETKNVDLDNITFDMFD